MRILIHAVPRRMRYVNEFLIPSLEAQGAGDIRVWLDNQGRGNLRSCVESFASLPEEGGTWHLQDDALVCRDFVKRARELEPDNGLVYGFCSKQFADIIELRGRVYMADAWHSFLCVRIPNAWAREFAGWIDTEAAQRPDLMGYVRMNRCDDYLFTEFCAERHAIGTAYNAWPCLAEHVDMLIGGSIVNEWRGYWVRAEEFADPDLTDALAEEMKKRRGSL